MPLTVGWDTPAVASYIGITWKHSSSPPPLLWTRSLKSPECEDHPGKYSSEHNPFLNEALPYLCHLWSALLPNNPAFPVTHSKGPLFLASWVRFYCESLCLGLAQLFVLNLTVREQPLEDVLLQHQGVATSAPLPGHTQGAVHSKAVNYSKSFDKSCQCWVTWLNIWMKNPLITVRRKQRGRDSITDYCWASQAGNLWNIIKIFPAGCDHRHQYFPFKWHWDMAPSCLPVINGIDKINESMFSGVMLWQVLAWHKRKIRTLKWVFLFCFSLMWDVRHWKKINKKAWRPTPKTIGTFKESPPSESLGYLQPEMHGAWDKTCSHSHSFAK